MTRVLNIITDSNIGGAGTVLLNYLAAADSENYETHIALPRGSLLSPALLRAGGLIHELPGLAERSYSRVDIPVLMQAIRQIAPDIVHTHGALSGRIAAKRCHVPVIYTRHSAFPVPNKLRYPPGRWVNKLVNEHYADHIIAVSPAALANLTDSGISPKIITTMMNGVAPLERPSEEHIDALRRSFGIPQGVFTFGILARIEEYKGHATIIEAAEILRSRGRKFAVIIAGTGGFEDELRDMVCAKSLEDIVKTVGFQSDVAGVLSLLDVQINASTGTDTSSLSILEGMSLCVPPLVSDYGGNPELVRDGLTGFIFPQRDAAALAGYIERLMTEPELKKAMGARSYELYSEKFTDDVFARNVENVYKRVLKK